MGGLRWLHSKSVGSEGDTHAVTQTVRRCLRPGRLPGQLIRVLAMALVAVALGCGEEAQSPTGPTAPTPEPQSALSTASVTALAFSQVSAGGYHTCGVTTGNVAYCWGSNEFGQLGDGSTDGLTALRSRPSMVAGGLRFRQVSAGSSHTCGVTTEKRVYCWGFNFDGELGDGTGYPTNIERLTPVPVAVARRFIQVWAGRDYTCAIEDETQAAFCWGYNILGQLGGGSTLARSKPDDGYPLPGYVWLDMPGKARHASESALEFSFERPEELERGT